MVVRVTAYNPVGSIEATVDKIPLSSAPMKGLFLGIFPIKIAKAKLDFLIVAGRNQCKACTVTQRHSDDKVQILYRV